MRTDQVRVFWCIAVFGLAVAGFACGGDDDDDNDAATGDDDDAAVAGVAGIYEARYADFQHEFGDGNVEVTMDFVRIDDAREVGDIEACEAEAERTGVPMDDDEEAHGVANPDALLIALDLREDGSYEAIIFRDHELESGCHVKMNGAYTTAGGALTFDDGEYELDFTQSADGKTLTLVHVVDNHIAPFHTENLIEASDDYGWLLGNWTIDGQAEERLEVADDGIRYTMLRQVGMEGDAAVPFPTVCHVTFSADSYTVERLADANGDERVSIRFLADEHVLNEHDANTENCDAHAAQVADRIASETGHHIEIQIEALPDGALKVDNSNVYIRE